MVFSSVIFLLYFLPLLLFVYHLVGKKWKNAILLLFSVFFYAWEAPRFVFVILATTLLDFFLVGYMDKAENPYKRKLLLLGSLSVNLGLLFYFKYFGFFIENVNAVLIAGGFTHIGWTKLALPIGISFYTFETLTYVIDVYRRTHKPLTNFWDYQLYIIFFPKLIAGPIIRYQDLAEQITDRSAQETPDDKLTGFYRFCIGLAKKVLIANVLGEQADVIFALPAEQLDSGTAWLGALSYTFQIYFDFSGYSDMAIGLAQIFGFRFLDNFNNPYTSRSITDFWRRWHISLGNWMRNYLYIPLGGNRVSASRIYFNLWLVFLASGLWHGASWNFIFWGAFHGLFLVLERAFLGRWLARIGVLSIFYTFLLVLTGWVFFRLEHFGAAMAYLQQMWAFDFNYRLSPEQLHLDKKYWIFFVIAIVFSFFALFKWGAGIQNYFYNRQQSSRIHLVFSLLFICLFLYCTLAVVVSDFNPFIYFRF